MSEKKKKEMVPVTNGTAINYFAKEHLPKIRKLFAPALTDPEFHFFVSLGKSFGANPFAGEIWAVRYDKSAPASIFLGRNYFRAIAENQPEYKGHTVNAIYGNDEFSYKMDENGKVKISHEFDFLDRGDLLGAYCVVWRSDIENPFFVIRKLSEYNRNQSTWKTQPETQICKVVEAQALRMAFEGRYKGVKSQDEQGIIEASYQEVEPEQNPYPDEPPSLTEPVEPPVTPEEIAEREKAKPKDGRLFEK